MARGYTRGIFQSVGAPDEKSVAQSAKHSMQMIALSNEAAGRKNASVVLLLIALLAAELFAAKVYMVSHYGNPTPFWDQWDAEAVRLYKPWLEGELTVGHLVEPHNEHRMFTTRIVLLALFEALGRRWDPVAQMYLNAVLHILAIALFFLFARSTVAPRLRWLLWIFAALLFPVPFGWDSTLMGLNTHFYVLLLGSAALLWATVEGEFTAGKAAWCLGLSFFLILTMASGALAVLAACGVLVFRRHILADRHIPVLVLCLLGTLAAAGVILTPQVPASAPWKAQSFAQFIAAVGQTWAWPLPANPSPPASIAMPALMQAPLLVGILVALRGSELRRPLLFLVAMGGWLFLQTIALAYGRAADVLSSRYLDFLAFGLLTNFAALLIAWSHSPAGWKSVLIFLTVVWLSAVTWSICRSLPVLQHDIAAKALASWTQEQNVRAYLMTNRESWLRDAGVLEIPYPSADRLLRLLNDETIRSVLPQRLFHRQILEPSRSHGRGPAH